MNKYSFTIEKTNENMRLDNYLSDCFDDVSRAKIQEMIKDKKVFVDGQVKKPSYKLRENENISVEFTANQEKKIEAENIPLDIVYEDENMAVINKPSGMLTHPTELESSGTLVNALLYKYKKNLSDINGEFRRGILHRLDRNTSGLLMVAKNNETHEFLANRIKEKSVVKKYLAFVKGNIKEDSGVINRPIGRNPSHPHKMAIIEDGKESITEFKVLERFKDATYLELNLKTGRTHQIRIHLSSLKHPVLNDSLYGGGNFKVKTQEQVLQSYKLEFTKPFSNDIIRIEIEPDEKIKKVLTYLKNKR